MSVIDQKQYQAMLKFRDDVLDLVERASSSLSVQQKEEVVDLVKQNESGVALETLAWIIVEEQKQVPKEIIEDILRIGHDIIDHEHMPDNLRSFAV